jgi:(p)ppGpp synthase/HD superfamily hydrolase
MTLTPRIVAVASNVAMEAHHKQVRKYTGEPYWTHCLAVARQVEEWGGTPEMIAAAYLHDVLEDTDYPLTRLYEVFGSPVVNIVRELTDEYTKERYPTLNRAERKDAEARRLGRISLEARVVKLADINDNTSSIVAHDPNFARTYLREKAFVLAMIGDPLTEWRNKK